MSEKQNILIVDDRKENLFALRQDLSGAGAGIVEATTGNQALAATLDNDFALAILDVQMPGMDGYELAALLRGDPKTAHLPVIFLTASHGEEVQVFKGYEAGAVDYIVKPYIPTILQAKVRVFLDLNRTQTDLGRKIIEIAASEERYQSLVATIPDIVYRIDAEGRFTFLNAAVRSLGYRPEELINRPFSEIILPADLEAVSSRFVLPKFEGQRTGDDGAPKLFDERRSGLRQTSGLEVSLLSRKIDSAIPVELYSGDPLVLVCELRSSGLYSGGFEGADRVYLGTVGIIRDITERKRTEWELAQHRDHLETLVAEGTAELTERVKEIACLYAISSLVAESCESIDETLKAAVDLIPPGWQHPEITCVRITFEGRDFTTTNFRDPAWKQSADIVISGQAVGTVEVCYLEERPQLYEGPERHLLIDIARQLAVMIVRKRAEEEREALRAQVMQSQKLESMGTLAGGVAHEINNPINGIMNYAQLMQDRLDEDSPLKEFASEIIVETERVATIVRNLLTFARQEKQTHSPARMVDIVEAMTSLISTIIRRDQITLDVDVPEDLPQVKCRSQQIQQVIMNLMTNARHALNQRYEGYDENKIIHLSAHTLEKEGVTWVRTTIEDHGTGIPAEVRERMFDPFFTTKDRAIGTGLGLSISYSIVQDHCGELSVESELGEYTRCHLDLPVDNGFKLED